MHVSKRTIPKSIRIFIRREKARICTTFASGEERTRALEALYARLKLPYSKESR